MCVRGREGAACVVLGVARARADDATRQGRAHNVTTHKARGARAAAVLVSCAGERAAAAASHVACRVQLSGSAHEETVLGEPRQRARYRRQRGGITMMYREQKGGIARIAGVYGSTLNRGVSKSPRSPEARIIPLDQYPFLLSCEVTHTELRGYSGIEPETSRKVDASGAAFSYGTAPLHFSYSAPTVQCSGDVAARRDTSATAAALRAARPGSSNVAEYWCCAQARSGSGASKRPAVPDTSNDTQPSHKKREGVGGGGTTKNSRTPLQYGMIVLQRSSNVRHRTRMCWPYVAFALRRAGYVSSAWLRDLSLLRDTSKSKNCRNNPIEYSLTKAYLSR